MEPILIIEDTLKYKKGQLLENYTPVEEGVEVDKDFLSESNFIVLNESLSKEDEKRIREIIRLQLKMMFWNLYTKQSVLVPST